MPNAVDAAVNFSSPTGNQTVTLDGSKTVGSLTLTNNSANTWTLSAGTPSTSSLAFNVSSGSGSLTVNGTGSGVNTISNNISLSDPLSVTINNTGGGLTISGVISDGSATNSLTLSGAGTLTLSNTSNSYGGGTVINGGTLVINDNAELGTAGVGVTFGGGTLDITAGGFSTGRPLTLNAGGGTIQTDTPANQSNLVTIKTGLGILLLVGNGSGDNTYTGGTIINAGTIQLSTNNSVNKLGTNGSLTINNSGVFDIHGVTTTLGNLNGSSSAQIYNNFGGNGTLTLTIGGGTASTDVGNFQGTISNNVGNSNVVNSGNNFGGGIAITKAGSGTIIFSGTNTYSGATTVNTGTLEAMTTGALPGYNTAGKVTVNTGATLAVAVGGGGQWVQTDIDTLRNDATFSSGFLGFDTTGGNFTYSSSIQNGAIGVSKLGPNTLTLTGSNTFNRGTNINGGTLALGSAGALSTSGGTISFGGGTLQFSANNTHDYTNLFSQAANQAYSIDTNGQTVTFATTAMQSSGGTFTKIGTGTLNFSRSNTYTGATTINGGTLSLNAAGAAGAASSGTSSITVNASGTLLITNSSGTTTDRINNSAGVTLNGGTFARSGAGTVSEGTGVHTTNGGGVGTTGTNAVGMGALTLQANSTLDFTTNASGVGTLVFASFVPNGHILNILNYTSAANPTTGVSGTDGTDDRLIFDQNESTNLADFSFGGVSATEIALGGGFFEIVPIPEPSTWIGGGFAALMLIVQIGRAHSFSKRAAKNQSSRC